MMMIKPKKPKNPVLFPSPTQKKEQPKSKQNDPVEPTTTTTISLPDHQIDKSLVGLGDENPVTIGNKVIKKSDQSFPHTLKFNKGTKIVLNLSPKVSTEDDLSPIPKSDEGVSYNHFKLNDKGEWIGSRVIHSPKQNDDLTFDPEHHLGFVSYEDPRTQQIQKFYVYKTNGGAKITESLLTGDNPFYLRDQFNEYDLSVLDKIQLNNSILEVQDNPSISSMIKLVEQVRFYTHDLVNVGIGLEY